MRPILSLFLLTILAHGASRVPGVDDLLKLKSAGAPAMSPDGQWVAWTVRATDFKQDAFVEQIWMASAKAPETSIQLTRGDKSSHSPRWSPDSRWLTFLSERSGGKAQVYAISPKGGEAIQLTKSESGVGNFRWSPDGKYLAYLAADAEEQRDKDRKEHMGDFQVVRKEYKHSHLWILEVKNAMETPETGTQRTKGKDRSIGSFSWSPTGDRIAFSATKNPDLIHNETSDIFILNLSDNSVAPLITSPGRDAGPEWSPDGRSIVFSSAMGRIGSAAYNSRLAIVQVAGGTPRSITDEFDEDPFLIDWKADGVYFWGFQKTRSHLFRVAPATSIIKRLSQPADLMGMGFSLSRDARNVAFSASSPKNLSEIYSSAVDDFTPRKLTDMTAQTNDFILAQREVITWKSKDATEIEGVLIKPADFDPSRKYPLLCVIHGGPTGIDRPTLSETPYYPADIWAGRGALVLKVNYRGSAGYGEKFRRLNIRNLGVGDAWDVLSGVDHLVAKGWVDPAKVGCMGWSQGGYISAFLTTSTDRFAAISVGAGISNWSTYYYNTDITPFTRRYLGADPIADPEIYQKTSPMSYIKSAKTPTLIQHGELDRRVPIANAYELRQGLEDRGIPVEMVVYKGFGHGINKPRAMRAVAQHNLVWFNHYIWGDPLPDLSTPELPKKETEKPKT